MFNIYCIFFISCLTFNVLAVPPSVCRADFRWDDCGKPAKAVMYYWKQGSRCEIGMWKGCLPNPNMFADEYECINTCVFVDKPTIRTETEEPETEVTSAYTNDTESITNATEEISTNDVANTTETNPTSPSDDSGKDGTGNGTQPDGGNATEANETTPT